ncbi:MAG: hypothetical protein ACI8RD_013267, partial [Bacillariaceae sp.]|jgi:hypothetical protein
VWFSLVLNGMLCVGANGNMVKFLMHQTREVHKREEILLQLNNIDRGECKIDVLASYKKSRD